MRFIESLCPPALLYLLYIVIQVGLDISLGLFLTAAVKLVMGVAGTVILNAFCGVDLGVVSWAIIATPFVITALAMSISLGLGLDRMATEYLKESFISPLTADNKKNRDKYVTQLKNEDAAPVPSNAIY
jgi:hypothetical protein